MDLDSSQGQSSDSSHPLAHIDPAILHRIKHLDLGQRVTLKDRHPVSGGAYGDVYKLQCDVPQRGTVTVAVKRFRLFLKDAIKILFEQEVYVWAKLRHKNVLPLLGYAFDDGGWPLLVSEWLDNGSAWSFVQKHPDCDVIRIIRGIAEGLHYLHSTEIVHSDIKSDNILMTKTRDPVICDFGFSRVLCPSLVVASLGDGVKGTLHYMAIELHLDPDATATKAADVWAFGMTLYELLTRQRPYADTRGAQAMIAIVQMRLPSLPSTLASPISQQTRDSLWGICQRCWEKQPEQRPDMDSILQMLPSEGSGLREIAQDTEINPQTTLPDVSTSVSESIESIEANGGPRRFISPSILHYINHLDLTGRVFFKKNRVISAGAYGDISKAVCDLPNRGKIIAAVKRLRLYLKEDIKFLFEKEIHVWAKLKHRNILPLLGFAFDSNTGYPLLVSKWARNGNAWNFVLSHPECDLMRLVTGIARGLAYLHKQGVIHSNIKSDNILVCGSQDAHVFGFESSRMINGSRLLANKSSGTRGTIRYLAYEIATGSSGNTKETDVWAFGMTVFELLTRKRPYANVAHDSQVISTIMKRVLPSIPHGLVLLKNGRRLFKICRLCWEFNPANRPDMRSVLDMLSANNSLMKNKRMTTKSTIAKSTTRRIRIPGGWSDFDSNFDSF